MTSCKYDGCHDEFVNPRGYCKYHSTILCEWCKRPAVVTTGPGRCLCPDCKSSQPGPKSAEEIFRVTVRNAIPAVERCLGCIVEGEIEQLYQTLEDLLHYLQETPDL